MDKCLLLSITPPGESIMETPKDLEVQAQFEEALEHTEAAANALLESNGWEILGELYKATFASIAATSIVVLPATRHKETILSKVSDPAGFEKNLSTVGREVADLIKAVQLLYKGHAGKAGAPTMDDYDLINDLTIGYSKVQLAMETAVQPLLIAMIDYLKEAGVDTETFFLGEGNNNV